MLVRARSCMTLKATVGYYDFIQSTMKYYFWALETQVESRHNLIFKMDFYGCAYRVC